METYVVSTLCKNGGAPIFRAIAAILVRNSRFIGAGRVKIFSDKNNQ
jgi:hypothetical protein